MSDRHSPSHPHPHPPRPSRHRVRTRLSTVGVLVASAAFGGATVNAEARDGRVDLQTTLARTERMLGAWEAPQYVLEATHRRMSIALGPLPRHLVSAAEQGGTPAAAPPRIFRFDIPFGSLSDALREFERVTGLVVTADGEITRGLTSGGATGNFTTEQALTRLLAGSALVWRLTSPTHVAIEVRVTGDTVSVSGSAPRIESTKYLAPLVETPQSIQIIPRTVIEEQGATTLSEVLRNVPGITMQAGEGGGASNTSGDMFNMRGFSAANSLFVDGVRDDGLIARDVYNLEQVEVFSGPTGSDVGRTNAAGYINLTTKTPGLRNTRSGSVTYGSGDSVRGTVDVNQALSMGEDGTFLGGAALRVNALWQDGGVAGRDDVERESQSIAPSLSLGLGTPTRLTVSGQVMRQDNTPDYGMPAAASPIGPLTATGVVAAAPVAQSTYYGSPDVDFDRADQSNATVRLEHDLRPGVSLRNQTRWNKTSREAVVTSIGSANSYNAATNLVTLSRQVNFRDNAVLSNQTSLVARVATGRIRHDLSLGLEISRERYDAPGMTGAGTRAPVDLNQPDVFSPVLDFTLLPTGALNEGRTNTVAFYVFDGIDLGTRLRLTGGIRVEQYDTSSHQISTAGAVTDLEGAGTLISGKAGVVYRLNRAGNLYLSYGSSLTPPGSSNFLLNANPTNVNNPNVDPQESVNYEVGTKWDLVGGRLLVNGAVFRTENTNVIFVVDNTTSPPIFNQDDGQRVTGAAFGVVGQILPTWDLTFNVQYLDSEIVSQNPNTNGHRLTLTPEVSGSVWTTVRLPRGVRIGAGVRHNDRVFINTANTISVPGYAIVDGLVEVPVGPRLALRLNVNNLTDKVYVRNISNNGGRFNPGTPRSFLLTTLIRF
jgi:catecholate siderophore receptor